MKRDTDHVRQKRQSSRKWKSRVEVSRRKNDFPALDIRENQRNASPNPFDNDDKINLHAPTPVQYGNEPEENKHTAKIKIKPQRFLNYDGDNSVFDDMNNFDQSINSVPVDNEDEDNAYEEFLEEEVLDYGLFMDRASRDPGCWKMENYDITMHRAI